MNVQDRSFYYRITAHDERHNLMVLMVWSDLPWHTRNRFDWYLRYRTALFQVQHPKWRVDANWGSKLRITKQEAEHKELISKIKGKKTWITRYQNRLKLAERNWCEIFPIQDHSGYKKLLANIHRAQLELTQLEQKLENHIA
jgi:hypothetical protein